MSQPNDSYSPENDDLDLDFSGFESEDSVQGSVDDLPDLDFSGFESEELGSDAAFPLEEESAGGDFDDFGDSADHDALFGLAPESLDIEETMLAGSAAGMSAVAAEPEPEPKTGKKGKKAKKEKPPKVKKEKPPKVKKEKTPKPPKPPRDPNAPGLRFEEMLALGACVLFAVLFLVLSVFSLGSMMFMILMDLIAVVVVLVPFFLFKFSKQVTLFEVSLGIAVIALSLGAIFLLSIWNRYDFAVKPNASLNTPQVISRWDA